jgi:Kdo2-lipid IVA lauroyltransferase/acyltransferase
MQEILFESLSACGQRLDFDSTWRAGWLLGNLLWQGVPQRREETVQRVALHLAKSPQRAMTIARQSYISNARSFLEIFMGRRLDERFFGERLTIRDPDLFFSVLDCGRPLVCVTAHMGAWELMSGLLGRFSGERRALVVVRKQRNQALDTMIHRLRARPGVEIVPHRLAAKKVVRCLRENGISAFLVDHNCSRDEALFLPFLGRIAAVNIGPALLTVRGKGLVWPVFLLRTGKGAYELVCSKPLDAATLEGSPRDRSEEMARFYTRAVGEQVRRHPEQWFWMHNRWKTQPAPLKIPDDLFGSRLL